MSYRYFCHRGLNLLSQVKLWLPHRETFGSSPLANWGCLGSVRFRSNRSRRGLYDGKDVHTGNQLSFSMRATKRKFKPNVFVKKLYSEIMDKIFTFRVTAAALRTIDKLGGLDNYLLRSKHVTEGSGMAVKRLIVKKLKSKELQGIIDSNPFLTDPAADDKVATSRTRLVKKRKKKRRSI